MDIVPLNELLTEQLSDAALIKAWGTVESALAQGQASLGMIPQAAADEITHVIATTPVRPEDLVQQRKKIGHLFIPYLRIIEDACPQYGNYLHYGATTENILYSAICLQLRQALRVVHTVQTDVIEAFMRLCEEHKRTVMPGRTHGQQALPITFGYKVAGWLDEYTRHLERQKQVHERAFRLMLGGAIGSFASFAEQGPALQQQVAELLEMKAMTVPLRSMTDAWVELGQVYALSASTLAKVACEFKTMSRSEQAEVMQDDGSVGSSTMPQKRNPVQYHAVLHAFEYLESAMQRLFRVRIVPDDGDSFAGFLQRNDIIDIVKLYYFMLQKMQHILATLFVDEQRMRDNLSVQGGWIMAESVMMSLAEDLGKTEAHDLLHDLAMHARSSGQSLRETLSTHPDLQRLSSERIDEILEPMHYIGACPELCEETVERMAALIAT